MNEKYKNLANVQSLRDAILDEESLDKMSDKEILYPVLLQLLDMIEPDNSFKADKVAEKILHLIDREKQNAN